MDQASFQAAGLGPMTWGGYNASFPDPWNDMASLAIPETMAYALRWQEFIMMVSGEYRSAVDRVLSYFITDIEIRSPNKDSKLNDSEKDKYEIFFRDTLGIYRLLHTIGLDYMTYGNAFISVIMPFKRYLWCPKCYLELPLKEVFDSPIFKFQWSNFDFHAKCPKCKYSGIWGHTDRKGHEKDLIIKRWNPHEIELLWDPATDQCTPIWKIPAEYRKMLKEGHLYHLERANWEVIQAVKNSNHLRFAKDFVFHLKEDCLAGVRNRGWGIGKILTNFRQVWYVQVLRRYNEAIALDYVIPFRLITPPPQTTSDPAARDPINNMNLGGFMARVNNMLTQRRRDPAAWFTLPFPVQYQALGGDATQLAPKELLDQGLEVLLNSVGVPVELYKGSLQIQSAPAALRLFESNWSHLVHNLNRLLAFLSGKIADSLMWEPVTVKLTRVTHADDLNRQMAKLQLMMGKQISSTTGLASVGLNYQDETRKMMAEESFQAEQQEKLQKEMEQSGQMQQMGQPQGQSGDPNAQAAQGGAPPGGDPSAGGQAPMQASPDPLADATMGDNTNITPNELMSKATNIAYQMLGLDSSTRQSKLIELKKKNPTLHAIVRSVMDNIKQQAQTQGGNQVLQQQFGGGGQQPPGGQQSPGG